MQKFVSGRDIVVRSAKAGMAIRFEKGKPMEVPKIMHEEVLEKGILPVDSDGAPADATKTKVGSEEKPKVVIPPEDAAEREEAILDVIRQVVAVNNPKDFTGGGAPKADVVSDVLKWRVDQQDVRRVWDKHKADVLAEKTKE